MTRKVFAKSKAQALIERILSDAAFGA